jgi:DNA-binding response OmpR family regulator
MQKKKILIVEDEQNLVTLLKLELTHENYHVVSAADGEEGLKKYVLEKPHLIILDIGLPKLNGYEVCRKIRTEKKDEFTPILMLTARNGDVDRIVGRVIGAQKYITKPFLIEYLLQEVSILLNRCYSAVKKNDI